MLKLTLKIKDINTDEKTKVFVAVPALSTTAVITAASAGSTCGGRGKTTLYPFGIVVSALND